MLTNTPIINVNKLKKTFKRFKKNLSKLIVKDVLDHLDFIIEQDKYLSELAYKINYRQYIPQKPYLLESPKNKGINRPTIVLSIEDALIYRYCIEEIEDKLIDKTRKNNIHGGIKITAVENSKGKKEYYEKWFDDWVAYNDAIKKALNFKNFAVNTDIASYFENINILILMDLIRSDVKGKDLILNLLFYFLENTKLRYNYEVNTYNGLLQEDIDCSRILAYYFLNPHDVIMFEFCKENNSEYYRFVDDMTILVESEVIGKKALKVLTESLRKLGLLSSIEKTSILNSKEMYDELFFNENENLTLIENNLINKIKLNIEYEDLKNEIENYYIKLKNELSNKKNWIKLLKRFYTLLSLSKSDILFNDIIEHIIKYPIIIYEDKIIKYLIINIKKRDKINEVLINILNYLRSDENLYPYVESELLEYFLYFDVELLNNELKENLKKLSEDIFFRKNYIPLSDYTRAISCLLFYKFNKNNIMKLVNHYLRSNESDNILKKYLIFVSLTYKNQNLRNNILNKAKKEQDNSINRFVNFIDNIKKYQNDKNIKKYLKEKDIYFYYEGKGQFEITEKYYPIRSLILKELIEIYK